MADHGIQITRTSVLPPPIRTLGQGVIGVVGTASGAAADGKFGDGTSVEFHEPFLLNSRADAPSADIGTTGSLPAVLNGIYRQGNVPVQMVIVPDGVGAAATPSEAFAMEEYRGFTTQSAIDAALVTDPIWSLISDGPHRHLVFKNAAAGDTTILRGLEPGRKVTVSASGGGSTLHTYTIEGDYDELHRRIEVNSNASHSGLTNATDYDLATVAVPAVTVADATRINLLGRESQLTGVYALLSASSAPTILCVGSTLANTRPGSNANTLAAGLVEIAIKLNAIAVLDGPNTSHADAITFAGDFDSARVYLVDPGVVTADGSVLASPSVAGKFAVTDFWESPSNMILNGVVGRGRLVDKVRAQALNDDYIATILHKKGFRLWGNETVTSTEPNYRFVNIQRTADAIEASLREAHQWAIDENITVNYFQLVAQSVQNFLDKLTSQAAITGGVCYPDDSKNTVDTIQEGQAFFQIEWSGAYPAQTLNINMELSGRFLEEILANL